MPGSLAGCVSLGPDPVWTRARFSPASGCAGRLLKEGGKRDLRLQRNLEELFGSARNENARAGTVIGRNDANIPGSRGSRRDAE